MARRGDLVPLPGWPGGAIAAGQLGLPDAHARMPRVTRQASQNGATRVDGPGNGRSRVTTQGEAPKEAQAAEVGAEAGEAKDERVVPA